MKAILIDPFNQTVEEVDYNGNYKHIYELIGADCFDAARISPTDSIFVDDNGLLTGPTHFFIICADDYSIGYPTPLAGRGLVLGTDEVGESISPNATLDEVRNATAFLEYIHGAFHGDMHAAEVHGRIQKKVMENAI